MVTATQRIETEAYLRKCVQAAVDRGTIKHAYQLKHFITMCDLPNPGELVSAIALELGGEEAGSVL